MVRYTEHPVQITVRSPITPPVVAPPIPPTARVGPSTSVPVHMALHTETPPAVTSAAPQAAEKPQKPSAFSVPVHVSKLESRPEPDPPERRPTGRVRIPPDPPAVIPLERTTVPSSTPPEKVAAITPPRLADPAVPAGVLRTADQAPAPAAAPPSAPPQADEANHATLKAGMLISVRIGQALSSNTNAAGDVFTGTLDRPLIADGFVIAERGAPVRGEVVDSKTAGRDSQLTIRLREVLASDGQRVHLVSNPWRKGSTGDDARARNIYEVPLTRGGAAVIRPATNITFRLDEPVELTEKR